MKHETNHGNSRIHYHRHILTFTIILKYGQIYISDKDGVNFSSSLRYNARVEDSIEFEKVLNLFI